MHKRIFAVSLCTLLLCAAITGCNKDPIVAKVGSAKIYNSQFKQFFDAYASSFGITDPTSTDESTVEAVAQLRDLILDTMISDEVQLQKAKELGLDNLTDAMKAEVDTQVQALFAEWHTNFESEAKSEYPTLTGDALEKKIQEMIDDYIATEGYTRDKIKQQYTETYIKQRLFDQATGNIVISDEYLQKTYQERVEQIKEIYAQDASVFESDFASATTLYYIPSGYRHIKYIFISMPDDIVSRIQGLRDDGYDAEAESIRNNELNAIKSKALEARGKLNPDGSNFDDIAKQYSDDSASTESTDGFAVTKDGQFPEEFISGCFAMKAPNTISGLIPTDYGYYIVLYIEPFTPGAIPFDTVKDALKAELLSYAKQDAFNTLSEQWRQEMKIEIYAENASYYQPLPSATPENSPADSPVPTT